MRRSLIIPLLLALSSSLPAQRSGFAHFSGRSAGFNRAGYGRAAGYYSVPFLDSYYPGYDAMSAVPPQPIVFLMQAPSTPPAADPAPPPQPLIIELQGDRYVQISGNAPAQSQLIDRLPAAQPAVHSTAATTALPQPPTTVLVFRDGHSQEISAYTITNSTLYAASNYYSSGAWNQSVNLSSLNLSETVAANQSRGVQFRLPSSPNEVIVGP